MTHLLPGCGFPRVQGARSPVPPRLPIFATPRSVCYLATIAAGAHALRRPPNAWSPGVPAPPVPCYWLVTSGTPMGWRGGCLATGLVRRSVCHYCLGGCSALFVCARRLRPVWAVWAGAGSCVSPLPPSLPPRSPRCLLRVVPVGCPLPSPAGTPFYAVCVFRVLGPVAFPVFPACSLRVCALALLRRPRASPLPGSVWRAHLAWFRCRAPVGLFHAVRAPPRLLPRSGALSGLLGGGGPFPPVPGSGLCVPSWAGLGGWVLGGGGWPAGRPPWGHGRRPRGGGVALPRWVPLPPLGGHKSKWHRRRSAHGGRGLHTVPVRVRAPTPGAARGVSLCTGAGLPVS